MIFTQQRNLVYVTLMAELEVIQLFVVGVVVGLCPDEIYC